MIEEYIEKTLNGKSDSDQHLLTLFSIALACKGKTYIELGVRNGTTTEPLTDAVKLNGGVLYSVDIDKNPFKADRNENWKYYECDSIQFLEDWEKAKNPTPDPYILNFWKPKTSLEEGINKIYESI